MYMFKFPFAKDDTNTPLKPNSDRTDWIRIRLASNRLWTEILKTSCYEKVNVKLLARYILLVCLKHNIKNVEKQYYFIVCTSLAIQDPCITTLFVLVYGDHHRQQTQKQFLE